MKNKWGRNRLLTDSMRKRMTVLLAFFVVLSTSYAMIRPGETLNREPAKGFIFFEGEDEPTARPELVNAEELINEEMAKESAAPVATEEPQPAEESPVETEEQPTTTVPVQETTVYTESEPEPTSTPASTYVPVFTEAPVIASEQTSDPESTGTPVPSATPEATQTPEATSTPETEETETTIKYDDWMSVKTADEKFGLQVKVQEDSQIPEDGKIELISLDEDYEDYSEYHDKAIEAVAEEYGIDAERLNVLDIFDLSFYDKEGVLVQPSNSSKVKVNFDQYKDTEDLHVVHFKGSTVKKEEEQSAVEEPASTKKLLKKNNISAEVQAKTVNAETDDIEILEVEPEEDGTVTFETESFSVYAVVDSGDTGDYARMNLHFMNGNKEIAMMIVKNNDTLEELETIIYDPGVGTIPDGQIFKGWSTTPSYTVADAENGMNIEEVRAWAEDYNITENQDVYLYAMLYKNYVINYLDENNVGVGSDNVFMLSTDTSSEYTVNMAYAPKDDTHAFLGWNVSEGGSNIQGHTEGTLYENGTDITITGNVTFSVNAPEGHWLVFDENGKGGTYNAPVFVESEEVTEKPRPDSEMVRFGYTFDGWYTLKAGVSIDNVPKTSEGYYDVTNTTYFEPFTFGKKITDRTTLYAKWKPATTANYTVIIWKEKSQDTYANNAAEGKTREYDFWKAYNLTGNVGDTINAVSNSSTSTSDVNGTYYDVRVQGTQQGGGNVNEVVSETGYHAAGYDTDVTIVPEGTSIVNVYYDRHTVTYTFYYPYSSGGYTYNVSTGDDDNDPQKYGYYNNNYVEITRYNNQWYRYGRNGWTIYYGTVYTRDESTPAGWQTYQKEIGLYGEKLNWPTDTSIFWKPEPGTNGNPSGTRMTYKDSFLPTDSDMSVDYYGYGATGSGSITFYLQDLSGGDNYTAANTITVSATSDGYNSVTFSVNDKYTGFEAYQYRYRTSASGNWTNWASVGSKNESTGIYGSAISYGHDLQIRYRRVSNTIAYMDGKYVDGNNNPIDEDGLGKIYETDEMFYETDLTSYNKNGANYYVPPANKTPAGYVFEGWYADEACTHEYTFTTMPVSGVTVYAKWRKIQYRVFLHPNADQISDLDWGTESQAMNFRLSIGEKVDTPEGRSAEWEFVGWYTDPNCTPSSLYSDDLTLNESTVTATYNKSTDFTDPMNKWGNLTGPGTNSDVDRFWITKKFDLYGKWRAKLIGAKGINVVYTADDGNGHVGRNAPQDNNQYLDQAEATAGAASTAPEGYQFVKWVVQEWNTETNQYEDTDRSVYPGDSFKVLKDDAKYVITGYANPADPEDISSTQDATHTEIVATYTIQLRAEYQKEGEGTPTYIHFYGNTQDKNGNAIEGVTIAPEGNEPKDVTTYNDIQINEAVDILSIDSVLNGSTFYKGYTFLGWAKSRTATEPWLKWNGTNYDIVQGQQQGVMTGVTKIAADEREPYENLYAVWERNPSYLYIVKTSANEENKYLAGALFELYQGETKLGEATTVATADGIKLDYALADGNYTLKEKTAPNGYKGIESDIAITVTNGKVSATGYDVVKSVDTDNNNAYTITVENTKLATVTVKKVVDSKISSDNDKEFTFTPTGLPMPEGETTFTLKHDQEKVFSDIPYGTVFSIAETPDNDFETTIAAVHKVNGEGNDEAMTLTGTSPATGNVTVDGDITITYTNKRTTADITVKKVMDSSFADDQTWKFAFEASLYNGETQVAFPDSVEATGVTFDNNRMVANFTLTDSTDSLTLPKLPAGYKLVVKEVNAEGTKNVANYTTTSTMGGTDETEQDAEYTLNQIIENGTITFTNTRNKKLIRIFKYETGSSPEKPLKGAVFSLVGPDGSGINYSQLTTNEKGYLVFSDTKTYIELPVNQGNAYILTETKAPDGYHMITEDVTFTVTTTGVVGSGSGYNVDTKQEKIDGTETTVYTIKVANSAGVELPHTGGSGTLPYTLSGLVLILFASMYSFSMRRRERRNE